MIRSKINMTNTKIWYLKQVDLFKDLKGKELKDVALLLHERACSKSEIIYSPFEQADCVYFLKKGEVTLYHLHRGKKVIIDVLGPGSMFGNIGFDRNTNSTHFAEFSEAGFLCLMKMDNFLDLLKRKPDLMINMLAIFSTKINDYETLMKSSLYDAKGKILQQLQIMKEKRQKRFLGGAFLKKVVTHEKLAHHTGLSRETVTRSLLDLKKEGRVRFLKDGEIEL